MRPDAGVSLTFGAEMLDALAEAVAERVAARLAAQAQNSASDGCLDTKHAAAYAGCSVNSLQKAMRAQEVHFAQDGHGRKAWFKREWIDHWRGA